MNGRRNILHDLRMSRKLVILCVILLLADLLYSAWQHYHGVLDGDMAGICLPAERYRQILRDPFGMGALLRDEHYGGVNRYFAHAAMAGWFRSVPFVFQWFVSPLTSVYLSCALIKILTQAWLIWIIAAYAGGTTRIRSDAFLLAAVLITPFFQTTGFDGAMSLIDASPTYVFFYALGFALLLTFFLPFYLAWRNGGAISGPGLLMLGLAAVLLVFNGPLNVPVLLLAVLATFVWQTTSWLGERGVRMFAAVDPLPWKIVLLASWCLLLCVYSTYIGRNNAENFWNGTVSLRERYRLLPQGIFQFFIGIKGCLLLLIAVAGNALLLFSQRREQAARSLLRLLCLILLFSCIYLLLLPLGGYRPYRPFIVKKDLALPVLLALMLFWAVSASWLLRNVQMLPTKVYAGGTVLLLLVLSLADKPHRGREYSQKMAILQLRASPDSLTVLPADCRVLTWEPVTNPEDSRTSVDMLRYWKILDADKRFIQR